MTPEQWAFEIRDWFYSDTPEDGDIEFLTSMVKRIEQEAVAQLIDGYNETLAIKNAYERGFRDGIEQIAKELEKANNTAAADKVRQLKP